MARWMYLVFSQHLPQEAFLERRVRRICPSLVRRRASELATRANGILTLSVAGYNSVRDERSTLGMFVLCGGLYAAVSLQHAVVLWCTS